MIIPESIEEFTESLLRVLDGLLPEPRVEMIDNLIHRLQFERRVSLLTPEQQEHMMSDGLSAVCRERLDKAKGTPEFDELIEQYARSNYFRHLAWVNYLNNGDEPPIPADTEKKQELREDCPDCGALIGASHRVTCRIKEPTS